MFKEIEEIILPYEEPDRAAIKNALLSLTVADRKSTLRTRVPKKQMDNVVETPEKSTRRRVQPINKEATPAPAEQPTRNLRKRKVISYKETFDDDDVPKKPKKNAKAVKNKNDNCISLVDYYHYLTINAKKAFAEEMLFILNRVSCSKIEFLKWLLDCEENAQNEGYHYYESLHTCQVLAVRTIVTVDNGNNKKRPKATMPQNNVVSSSNASNNDLIPRPEIPNAETVQVVSVARNEIEAPANYGPAVEQVQEPNRIPAAEENSLYSDDLMEMAPARRKWTAWKRQNPDL